MITPISVEIYRLYSQIKDAIMNSIDKIGKEDKRNKEFITEVLFETLRELKMGKILLHNFDFERIPEEIFKMLVKANDEPAMQEEQQSEGDHVSFMTGGNQYLEEIVCKNQPVKDEESNASLSTRI